MRLKTFCFDILCLLIIISCLIGFLVTEDTKCFIAFGVFGTIWATCFSAFYQVAAITKVDETLTAKENDSKDIKEVLHKIDNNFKRTFAIAEDSNRNPVEGFIWNKNDYELQEINQVIFFKNEKAFDKIKKFAFISHPKYCHQCEIVNVDEKEKSITIKL